MPYKPATGLLLIKNTLVAETCQLQIAVNERLPKQKFLSLVSLIRERLFGLTMLGMEITGGD
ncbi:MAG: hypothetical protein DRH17_00070 [Deltaproteobacteria bacterium]|nr:MAG: hypothetical protein DRH17_00070 [Deltaproteobacteria bacterium]